MSMVVSAIPLADPNVDWDFSPEFLEAFYNTRGLCPAQPEGDFAFMSFLLAICEEYNRIITVPSPPPEES
jgi:hypothetical protein